MDPIGNDKSSIIRHHFPEKCNWLRFFRGKLLKGNVVLLLIINMTNSHYCLHQTPIPWSLVQILLKTWERKWIRRATILASVRRLWTQCVCVWRTYQSYLSPIFMKRLMGCPQIIAWYPWRNMVGDMDINIMT